nr:substrate-binding domain-containing protein [Heliorestis acidaminivorans]
MTACGASTPEGNSEVVKKDVILATTTSTQDSGLLDTLLPVFEEEYGYFVKTIAVGTGQALAMGEKGDADVLLTHAPDAELKLYENGDIQNYRLVMHNDFVIVGPANDPAGIKGLASSSEAFQKVAEAGELFVSRADDSGTHKKELSIWKKAGLDTNGSWYIETGSGMGQTLNIASEKSGYTLTDRGTYLALQKSLDLEILVEGETDLLNIYHVAQVNPEKSNLINAEGAKAFVEFMVSEKAQSIIKDFGIAEYGSPLFFPDAGKDPAEYGLNYKPEK